MSGDFGLILDIMVVVLLVATIFYAVTLSHRLSQLRGDRRELESVVRGLAEAAAKADAGVKGLRATAERTGSDLQKKLDQVESIREELAFLVDTGEKLADRLESSVAQASEEQQRRRSAAAGRAATAVCQPGIPANRGRSRSQPNARCGPAETVDKPAETTRQAVNAGATAGAADSRLIHAIESLR